MKKFKFAGTTDVFVQCKLRACAQLPCGVCRDERRSLFDQERGLFSFDPKEGEEYTPVGHVVLNPHDRTALVFGGRGDETANIVDKVKKTRGGGVDVDTPFSLPETAGHCADVTGITTGPPPPETPENTRLLESHPPCKTERYGVSRPIILKSELVLASVEASWAVENKESLEATLAEVLGLQLDVFSGLAPNDPPEELKITKIKQHGSSSARGSGSRRKTKRQRQLALVTSADVDEFLREDGIPGRMIAVDGGGSSIPSSKRARFPEREGENSRFRDQGIRQILEKPPLSFSVPGELVPDAYKVDPKDENGYELRKLEKKPAEDEHRDPAQRLLQALPQITAVVKIDFEVGLPNTIERQRAAGSVLMKLANRDTNTTSLFVEKLDEQLEKLNLPPLRLSVSAVAFATPTIFTNRASLEKEQQERNERARLALLGLTETKDKGLGLTDLQKALIAAFSVVALLLIVLGTVCFVRKNPEWLLDWYGAAGESGDSDSSGRKEALEEADQDARLDGVLENRALEDAVDGGAVGEESGAEDVVEGGGPPDGVGGGEKINSLTNGAEENDGLGLMEPGETTKEIVPFSSVDAENANADLADGGQNDVTLNQQSPANQRPHSGSHRKGWRPFSSAKRRKKNATAPAEDEEDQRSLDEVMVASDPALQSATSRSGSRGVSPQVSCELRRPGVAVENAELLDAGEPVEDDHVQQNDDGEDDDDDPPAVSGAKPPSRTGSFRSKLKLKKPPMRIVPIVPLPKKERKILNAKQRSADLMDPDIAVGNPYIEADAMNYDGGWTPDDPDGWAAPPSHEREPEDHVSVLVPASADDDRNLDDDLGVDVNQDEAGYGHLEGGDNINVEYAAAATWDEEERYGLGHAAGPLLVPVVPQVVVPEGAPEGGAPPPPQALHNMDEVFEEAIGSWGKGGAPERSSASTHQGAASTAADGPSNGFEGGNSWSRAADCQPDPELLPPPTAPVDVVGTPTVVNMIPPVVGGGRGGPGGHGVESAIIHDRPTTAVMD